MSLKTVLLVSFSLLCSFAIHAQQHKTQKTSRKKTEKFIPPVIFDKREDEQQPLGVPELSGSNASEAPVQSDFDFEAYKANIKTMDSLQKAYGIFRRSDSMAAVVLAHYMDTCRHPGSLHDKLDVSHFKKYHEEIVLKPYKGIWRVWYYFDEELYRETYKPRDGERKVFPYHFLIVVDQKKGTATISKEQFDDRYKPQ